MKKKLYSAHMLRIFLIRMHMWGLKYLNSGHQSNQKTHLACIALTQ